MDYPLFILGSGVSVNEGAKQGLFSILPEYCVMGINSIYRWYTPSCHIFLDWFFYGNNKKELDSLSKQIPVFSYKSNMYYQKNIELADTINWIKISNKYHGIDAWKIGFYHPVLSGCLAINLGIALGFKEIYLLGYDACAINGKTHWYTKLPENTKYGNGTEANRGIGFNEKGEYKTNLYNQETELNKWFEPFLNAPIQIYNVSPESKLHIFNKINYNEFFSNLQNYDKFPRSKYVKDILDKTKASMIY